LGDEAAAEFCAGPPGHPERSALRWCTSMLQRGVPDSGNPAEAGPDATTQVLIFSFMCS